MIYSSIFLIFLNLSIIQFSFSDVFGDYFWEMICVLKIVATGVDYALEKQLDELLLVAPLSIQVIVILSLVTFGAEDFLDFLNAYFVELGIMIIERCYFWCIVEVFTEYMENKIPRLINFVIIWVSNEPEDLDNELFLDDAAYKARKE